MPATFKAILVGAVFSAGLMSIPGASAATVIVAPIYNEYDPGGAFTPTEPLGSILNTPLYETVTGKCKTKNACTYDFTFTLADIPPGTTSQIQLQAAAQTMSSSTPQPLDYDLFSGTPGHVTFTPISSATFIAASGPPGTVGEIINASLPDGTYYVQVIPAAVIVSGENGSGSLTEMGVPEPMAWSLMLMGVGCVGGSLRRRRVVPASTVAA